MKQIGQTKPAYGVILTTFALKMFVINILTDKLN